LSTERRRSAERDAHGDVSVNGNTLDGDAFAAFDGDAFAAFDGDAVRTFDALDGDGLDRDACSCSCGDEGRATTIAARRTRRSTVTAWSCRDCGRTHSRVSPGRWGGEAGRWGGAVGRGGAKGRARRHAGRG